MYKNENIVIGKRIKEIRASLKMKQKEFAYKIGATVSALSNWENGRNKPNDIMAKAIADLGNITVNELLHGNKEDFIKKIGYKAYQDLKNNKTIVSKVEEREADYLEIINNKVSEFLESDNIFEEDYIIYDSFMRTFYCELDYNKRNDKNAIKFIEHQLGLNIDNINDYLESSLTQKAIKNGDISREAYDFILKHLEKIRSLYSEAYSKKIEK